MEGSEVSLLVRQRVGVEVPALKEVGEQSRATARDEVLEDREVLG